MPEGSVLHKCSEKKHKNGVPRSTQPLKIQHRQRSGPDAVCFVADAPLRQQLAGDRWSTTSLWTEERAGGVRSCLTVLNV